jgi:hypothetical protein
VTGTAADVLASIDGALAAYGTAGYGDTGSSMRWRPEPPALVICDDGQPLQPLPRSGPSRQEPKPVFVVTRHYRIAGGFLACVRAEVYTKAGQAAAAAKMKAARHPYPGWSPRPASRCEECNPHGNPGPLAVDGHEYTRRRKARQRRKHGR